MKKIFLLVSIALVTGFMTSCSNEDDIETKVPNSVEKTKEEQENELLRLQTDIAKLKDNFPHRKPDFVTRGRFGRGGTIVHCDIAGSSIGRIGGFWGSLIVGTVSSCVAYIATRQKLGTRIPQGSALNNTILRTGSTPNSIDSIGYYHNKIIMGIPPQKLAKADTRAIINNLVVESASKVLNKPESELKLMLNNEGLSFIKRNIDSLTVAESTDKFCDILERCSYFDSGEMGVLREYMKGLDTIENSDNQYSMEVIELVKASEIDEDTKSSIIRSVVVGNASDKMWFGTNRLSN